MSFCWDAAPLSRVQCLECNGWILTRSSIRFWTTGAASPDLSVTVAQKLKDCVDVCLAATHRHGPGSQWMW